VWLCTTGGFPPVPFVVDVDVSTPDGVISCRRIGEAELLTLGWRVARALRILLNVPWLP
jgi:hypothetical protein